MASGPEEESSVHNGETPESGYGGEYKYISLNMEIEVWF